MNNSTQAQKGFQTFVLTLSVSLIIFSVIYYFVTNLNTTPDISADISEEVSMQEKEEQNVAKDETASVETETVFKTLADKQMNVERRAVLSGATEELATGESAEEATESSPVPDSGVFSVTAGLVSSVMLFVFAAWVIVKGPRSMALSRFEQRFIRD